MEYREIENVLEKEIGKNRNFYKAKGFEGELLEQAVLVVVSGKDNWVDVMMKEELGMIEGNKSLLKLDLFL